MLFLRYIAIEISYYAENLELIRIVSGKFGFRILLIRIQGKIALYLLTLINISLNYCFENAQ